MIFKMNLNRICKERGTSFTPVMKALGYYSSKTTAINNDQIPKEETLIELAKHLHCSVKDFFVDDLDMSINQNNSSRNITNKMGTSENTKNINYDNTINNYYCYGESSNTNINLVFCVIDSITIMYMN